MPGHVFVIHGRMETLVKDAVVITTDGEFRLEPHWEPVLAGADPQALRPEGWAEDDRLFGQARGRDDLWFLNVSDPSGLDGMLQGFRGVVEAIAESGLRASAGRELPLVAVPVPGVRGGGFGERAGAVIAGLLRALAEVLELHDIDVVIVATTAAQFAAIQRERRLSGSFPLSPEHLEKAEAIGDAAAAGTLALFLGAGVSIPAGLPAWADLVEEMRSAAIEAGADIPEADFAALGVLDQTELLRDELGDKLEAMVAQRFDATTPALSHALLAGLRCLEAVTTNYDRCYETAVAAQDAETSVAVMPWEKPVPGRPWLLKLHGDAARPESVVLTRGQFIGYDSRWRPVGSVFQSLMMTRQLLVVGASLSDDNVLRLAHEVRALRQEHSIDDPLGHVLTLGAVPLRARLWAGELEWVALPGETREAQARQLEIFLDAASTHACHSSSYLLDPHFADLLEGEVETELASLARDLAVRLESAASEKSLRPGTGWFKLLTILRSWGAPV